MRRLFAVAIVLLTVLGGVPAGAQPATLVAPALSEAKEPASVPSRVQVTVPSATPTANSTPTMPVTCQESQKDPRSNRQTILLWPKEFLQFMSEYSSWKMWLGNRRTSPYSLRDELLVSVRAIATMVPDLEVETDEPDSDIIIVSGNSAALGVLLDRLRDHPLLAQVTEDSPARRDEARTTWAQRSGIGYGTPQYFPVPEVNIRNNWVTNVVWGYSAPGATIAVTLTRSSSHVLTTTTTANLEGLYHAYLIWEIREGDVIEVSDSTKVKTVPVIPLKASGETSTVIVTGLAPPIPEMPERSSGPRPSLEVTIGQASQSVIVSSGGTFTADFADKPFRPGIPGFLRHTDADGNRIFMPFSTPIVNVRRDTTNGLPYGSAHSAGISSIVWGSATPSAALVITLTHSGDLVVTRTLTADQVGSFSVSVDRLIEDGDIVQVFDGADVATVQVPTTTFHADPVTRIITGTAPAGIATTVPGAPHSFQISIGGNTRQVTTTATGEFSADFTANSYLAGLLGTLRYTTPDGDRVYKTLFVVDPLARGELGDWRADTILGQPDFSQITFNEVVSNKLFNPNGVYVDRSIQPNRVYVYDAGNSRVLGLSHLGVCLAGANEGQDCTTDSDCPSSACQIQEERAADIVLGQPSFNMSACNGDSGYQMYPDVPMASAETLCGLREEQMSISEGGSAATMATDAQGNLYVPDFFNNRVLRYNSPFTTDTIADYVWGQADFSGITCNRGASYGHPDKGSMCLASPPGYGDIKAGLAIDSDGNLWVADNRNNRVLRFPFDPTLGVPAQEADLVLGQPDFSTATPGDGLNQMHNPASVRVDSDGVVYVAAGVLGAGGEGRVLVFEPPLSNGMLASWTLGSELGEPTGLEIDPDGGVWVNDCDNRRLLCFVNGELQETVDSVPSSIWGGLGVDRDGNVMVTGWEPQQVLRFSAPTYTQDSAFLRADEYGLFNQTGPRGLCGGRGLEVAAGQLIYADGKRMLFWNNPWSLANHQPANGFIGQPDFQTRPRWGPEFGRMRADEQGRLWVVYGATWEDTTVRGYDLPLSTGAMPVFALSSPLPLQGGGVFTWTGDLALGGIDVQPDCDCLWLSDEENHRAFRIKDVSSQPVVDIVLGQLDVSRTECNQGRGRDFPSQDSLCHPGALAFDRAGNLYVADHNLEFDGNLRLLEFDADTIPDAPTSAVFGIPATRVFGRNGDFTEPNCLPREQDPMCGPWEPAFDSRGCMVVGFNCYLGPRFPMVYQDPLTNPLPIAALGDFHSMPLSARFDQFDNLYILDHNRSRILIYRDRQVQTYTVTGMIETASGDPIPGVQVETIGYASSGVSDASGVYTLTGLVTGTYELLPGGDYTFTPISRTISVPPSATGQDFVGIGVPVLIAPADGLATEARELAFEWHPALGAAEYRIQIDIVETFDSPDLISDTVPSTTYSATLSVGTWYWRVLSIDEEENESGFSRAWRLAVADPIIQVTTDTAGDRTPAVMEASDGKLWVFWQSYRAGGFPYLWYKTSSDGGHTWSPAVQFTSDHTDDYDPAIIQAADGTLWVVWYSYRSGNHDIWYKTSDDGLTWSTATQLTTDTSSDYAPDITQTADGTLWVVWYSYRSGNADIWYKSSTNGGATWSAATQLTTDTDYDYYPTVAQAADGAVWVVWQRNSLLWYRTSSDGGTTWSSGGQIDGNCCHYRPTLTIAGDGVMWLASQRSDDIWYQTSSDNGITWSTAQQWTRFVGDDDYPNLAALSGNQVGLVWQSNRSGNDDVWFGIFGQREDVNPPPYISSVEHTPSPNPDSNDVVTFRAYAQDESAVASVHLVWDLNGASQADAIMYDDGIHDDYEPNDNWYGVQLGPFAAGDSVSYAARATDGDGNTYTYAGTRSFQVLEPFTRTADILFVPDYGGNSTDWFRPYYTNTLDDLGYAYDVWDTGLRAAPDSAILNLYTDDVVIWAVPYWGYFDNWDVRPDIEAYLDAGGKLFMTGQNVAQYLSWGGLNLLNNYLHATYVQYDTDLYALNGMAGDPIGDGLALGISGGDGASNQYETDEIDPISPAMTVFTYGTSATTALLETEAEPAVSPTGVISSGTAGLRVDAGTYKVVYFAFGFEGINSAGDRATVMGRVLAWLQGMQPLVASFTSSSPDWLGQETVFTNTTVVTGPVSCLWAFGDGVTSTLESPTYTYAIPGVYTVVLTATNILGSDVATGTVIIHALPTVRITPASRNVKPQATHTLTVTVENALDLGAFEFDLTFDPALLRVDDVTPCDFLGSTGRNVGELGPDIDNDTGLVTYGAFSFGSQDGPNGTGTLAIVEFTTFITPGVSALNLQNVQLSDTDVQTQPVQAVGGSVTIAFFGDLDYDGDVDIDDIMIVVAHWNSETGDPDYDSRYDFDADGDIDVLDVMRVAAAWGSTCGGMAAVRAAPAAHLDQEGADMRFDPPTVMAQAGVPFTMNVAIAQAADLGGFEFDLLFDPDVITITGVHLGDFMASQGNNTVAMGPRYDEKGRLVFGGFSYGEHGGADGYGSLATLELTLLSEAEAVLRLEDVQLVTSDAEGAPLHSVGEGHVRAGARIYLPLVLRRYP